MDILLNMHKGGIMAHITEAYITIHKTFNTNETQDDPQFWSDNMIQKYLTEHAISPDDVETVTASVETFDSDETSEE